MNDELFDVVPLDERFTVVRVAGQVAAVGAICGALEGAFLAGRVKLLLTAAERVELAIGAALADTVVAFGAGLVGGMLAFVLPKRMERWRRDRFGFSLAVALFSGFFFLPMGLELIVRNDALHAAGMFGLVLSLAALAWFNAGYWYRRQAIGLAPRIGWKIPGFSFATILCGTAAFMAPSVPRIAPAPPESPNLFIISIDTLRRDHVGAFGGKVPTPTLDRLAAEGAAFNGAITPLPETAPSHASMFTGLHPAEHDVVQNGRRLSTGHVTIADQLSALGWRSGAFVSAFAVDSSTGLDQGFSVYDDDFLPAFRGMSEFRAGQLGLKILMRFGNPADWPSLLERDAPDTLQRALSWMDRVPETQPVFTWVHLFEPHSPYDLHAGASGEIPPFLDQRPILADEPGHAYTEPEISALRQQYGAEVTYVDAQIGEFLDGVRARGRLKNAMVLVVADHGESLGEHGIMFNHHGLYEEVLRVPLILWESKPQEWLPGARSDALVTVQDVANTVLESAGVPLLQDTTSLPLTYRLTNRDVRAEPVLLMGRSDADWLYGVRSTQGVKYIVAGEKEELYDLVSDPFEANNLAATQPAAVKGGRDNVAMLKRHIDRKSSVADGAADMLEALGYTEPSAASPGPPMAPSVP